MKHVSELERVMYSSPFLLTDRPNLLKTKAGHMWALSTLTLKTKHETQSYHHSVQWDKYKAYPSILEKRGEWVTKRELFGQGQEFWAQLHHRGINIPKGMKWKWPELLRAVLDFLSFWLSKWNWCLLKAMKKKNRLRWKKVTGRQWLF